MEKLKAEKLIKNFLTARFTLKVNTKKNENLESVVNKITVVKHIEKSVYKVFCTIFINNKKDRDSVYEIEFPTSIFAYSQNKTSITIARVNNEIKHYSKGISSNTIFIDFDNNEVNIGNYLVIKDIEIAKKILDTRKITDEEFTNNVKRRLQLVSKLEWRNQYNQERYDQLPELSKEWVIDYIKSIKYKDSVKNKIQYILKIENPPQKIDRYFIECLEKIYKNKIDEITPFDISFIDYDEELYKYLKKNSLIIHTLMMKKFADNKEIYPNTIQTYIRKYLTGQADTMRNIQQSQDTNPLSELVQGRKIFFVDSNANSIDTKIPINIDNFMGIIDPVHSSEQKSNIDNKLTNGISFVGEKMFIKVYDKQFNELTIPIEEYMNNPVLTYENVDYRSLKIIKKEDDLYQCYLYGEYTYRHLKDIKYIRHMSTLVSYSSNRVPFINKTYVGRGLYGLVQQTQAVKTVSSDLPIIDTGADKEVYENTLSHLKSPVSGKIIKYESGIVIIKKEDGEEVPVELKEEFKVTMNHNYNKYIPRFKVGQLVKENDVLFSMDYFDDQGNMKLSIPAYVALMTYYSKENNDSFVISESFAKKLFREEETVIDIPLYTDKYRLKINELGKSPQERISLPNVGDKIGSYEEIFSYGVVVDDKTEEGNIYKLLHRENKELVKTKTIYSPYEIYNGTVTSVQVIPLKKTYSEKYKKYLKELEEDCYKIKKELLGKKFELNKEEYEDSEAECVIRIVINFTRKPSEGTKLSFLTGNKGTVSNIIPDYKMPKTKDGRVVDIIISPLAEVPRMLGGQPYLLYLGKMAFKIYDRLLNNDIDEDLVEVLKFLFPKENKINPQTILNKYGHNGYLRFKFLPYDNSINEEKLLELMKKAKVPQKEYVWIEGNKVRSLVDVGYMDILFLHIDSQKKIKISPTILYKDTVNGYGSIRGLKHGENKYGSEMDKHGQSVSETFNGMLGWGTNEEFKESLKNRGISFRQNVDDAFASFLIRVSNNF